MQKTAKVEAVLGCKPFDGQHGKVYYHKIKLDNGEVGEIGAKKENAFNPGDELTYTSEEGQYGLKFKKVLENNFNGGGFKGGKPTSTSAMALAYSKDLIVAQIEAGKTGDLKTADLVNAILSVATTFHNFIKEHE
jgi:hypothetical protein